MATSWRSMLESSLHTPIMYASWMLKLCPTRLASYR